MFEKILIHVGAHACQHPEKTLATVAAVAKFVAPALPALAGIAAAIGIVCLISKD